jgi:hypothetical protein
MDILAGLRDKLRFIERHYAAASEPFRETKRKIDAREEPFVPQPFDPETATDFDPPFLEEWQEATESLNIEGQAALKLVQSALREYLISFVDMYEIPLKTTGRNWLERYKKHFLDVYGIDWDKAPVPVAELEEVNLARNDVEHSGEPFGMTRRQSQEHERRFPAGLFVNEVEKQVFQASGHSWPGRIEVTDAGLKEAIRRVEIFCEYLDSQRI